MIASDSDTDEIDENAIHDVEADLLESVYVYLTEGKYQEGRVSANQKRVIRKKAANFRIVNGEKM